MTYKSESLTPVKPLLRFLHILGGFSLIFPFHWSVLQYGEWSKQIAAIFPRILHWAILIEPSLALKQPVYVSFPYLKRQLSHPPFFLLFLSFCTFLYLYLLCLFSLPHMHPPTLTVILSLSVLCYPHSFFTRPFIMCRLSLRIWCGNDSLCVVLYNSLIRCLCDKGCLRNKREHLSCWPHPCYLYAGLNWTELLYVLHNFSGWWDEVGASKRLHKPDLAHIKTETHFFMYCIPFFPLNKSFNNIAFLTFTSELPLCFPILYICI